MRFGPDDIEYIILDSEDEIVDMVAEVRRIKERSYSNQPDIITKLTTKIITAKRIREDM